MPNEFLTVKNIARQTLLRLQEELVFPNLIYKDFSNDFQPGQGATIQVRKPVILSAEDFDETSGITTQDVKEASVEVTLDKLANVSVNFTDIQRATSADDLNRLFIEPAAQALAEKINADGLKLYKDIPSYVGSAGVTPSGLASLAAVRKQLNKQKVPAAGRVAVWDTEADAAFTTVDAIVNAEKSGTTAALREGSIGRVFGLDNYMSQAVITHNGGSAAGSLKVDGAVSAGSTTIHIDGATSATATIAAGDMLVIDGVHYVCTEDVTFDSNEGDVKVYPATPDNIKDNTSVTIAQGGTQNLAFNPMAFAFVTRPLPTPAGVEAYTVSYGGLSLRVVRGYDQTYKKETLSMDILYGYKTMYPELAVRVLG